MKDIIFIEKGSIKKKDIEMLKEHFTVVIHKGFSKPYIVSLKQQNDQCSYNVNVQGFDNKEVCYTVDNTSYTNNEYQEVNDEK